MRPLIEVQDIEMEAHLCSTSDNGVSATTLEGVTAGGEDKPTSFSKGHNSLWDFEDED